MLSVLTIHTTEGLFRSKAFRDPEAADRAFDEAVETYGPGFYYRLTCGGFIIREV